MPPSASGPCLLLLGYLVVHNPVTLHFDFGLDFVIVHIDFGVMENMGIADALSLFLDAFLVVHLLFFFGFVLGFFFSSLLI